MEFVNGESTFAQIAKHANLIMKHATGINKARLLGPLMAALV
jgi:hypothetical protein